MNIQSKNKTALAVTTGGIAVFVVGAILGSFFMLRGEGESFFLSAASNPTMAGSDSSLNFSQPPEEVTKNFLKFLAEQGVTQRLSPDDFKDDEFITKTVRPYIEEQGASLFVTPPTEIKVGNVSRTQYVESMKVQYLVMASMWQKLVFFSERDSLSAADTKGLRAMLLILNTAYKDMAEMPVPKDLESFHRQSLHLAWSLRVITESGFLNEDDPLRRLSVLANFDGVSTLALSLRKNLAAIEQGGAL